MSREVWTIDVKKMLKNNARMTVLLSAIIALVVSSFATVPTVNAAQISHVCQTGDGACAGYVGAISAGEITHVTGEWNQPAVTCQPLLAKRQAINMGIGIANPGITFIVGIHDECAQGSSTPTYVAGTIFIVGVLSVSTVFTLTVNPGDEFSASIDLSPSTQVLTASITDLTTGQSASITFGQILANPKSVSWGIGINTTLAALAQFSVPIRFRNCATTVSGQTFTISKIATVVRFTMADGAGNTMAATSHLSKGGSSFNVTWVNST